MIDIFWVPLSEEMLSGCDVKLLLILLTLSRSSCLITNCAKLIFVWLLYYNKISRPFFSSTVFLPFLYIKLVQTKICCLLKPALTTKKWTLSSYEIDYFVTANLLGNKVVNYPLIRQETQKSRYNQENPFIFLSFWSRIKQFIIPFPGRYSLTQKYL